MLIRNEELRKSPPMKILFITPVLPHPQGISGSMIIYYRLRYLVEHGHQVGLASFVTPAEEPLRNDLRSLVSSGTYLPTPKMQPWIRRLGSLFFSAMPSPFREMRSRAMARVVGEMVEREHYQVAIAEFSVMGQYFRHNPFLPAVRRIVSCHECCFKSYNTAIRYHGYAPSGIIKRIGIRQVRKFEFDIYRQADHVLVLTPTERFLLLQQAPNLRITVVPHGVDVNYYTPSPEAERVDSLLFIGYYHNESNRDAVCWFARTVWPELKKLFPHLLFYVVGRGATDSIKDLARRDPQIIVTGEVADLRPYLAKARVFICPVRMGSGFRAKILDAMASGVPVVATSLGAEGIPANGGETLMLADTPDQMLSCINLLLSDASLRAGMAAKARDLVVRRFAREEQLTGLDQVLEGVVRE